MAEAITLQDVYTELKHIEDRMITKEELNKLVETIEIMHNPETMKQLAQSAEDIKSGKVKEIDSVQDLINEL